MKQINARGRLYRLLTEFRKGRLDTVGFCDQFEQTYNSVLDKKTLAPSEAEAFGALFEKVIWYSPYAEERAQIPNYIGEDELRRVVNVISEKLSGTG